MIKNCIFFLCGNKQPKKLDTARILQWNNEELQKFKEYLIDKQGNRLSEIWYYYQLEKESEHIAIVNTLFKCTALEALVSNYEHLNEILNLNCSSVKGYLKPDPLLSKNTHVFIKILNECVSRAKFYKENKELKNLLENKEIFKKMDFRSNLITSQRIKWILDNITLDYFKLDFEEFNDSFYDLKNARDNKYARDGRDERYGRNEDGVDYILDISRALVGIRFEYFTTLVRLNAIIFTLLSARAPFLDADDIFMLIDAMKEINQKTHSILTKVLINTTETEKGIEVEKLWIDERLINTLESLYLIKSGASPKSDQDFNLNHIILDEGLRLLVKLKGVKNKKYFKDLENLIFGNVKENMKNEKNQRIKNKIKGFGNSLSAMHANKKDNKRKRRRSKAKKRRFALSDPESDEDEKEVPEDELEAILAESDETFTETRYRDDNHLSTIKEMTQSHEETSNENHRKNSYDFPEFRRIFSPLNIEKRKQEPPNNDKKLKDVILFQVKKVESEKNSLTKKES